jgi:hypothetical protein
VYFRSSSKALAVVVAERAPSLSHPMLAESKVWEQMACKKVIKKT